MVSWIYKGNSFIPRAHYFNNYCLPSYNHPPSFTSPLPAPLFNLTTSTPLSLLTHPTLSHLTSHSPYPLPSPFSLLTHPTLSQLPFHSSLSLTPYTIFDLFQKYIPLLHASVSPPSFPFLYRINLNV